MTNEALYWVCLGLEILAQKDCCGYTYAWEAVMGACHEGANTTASSASCRILTPLLEWGVVPLIGIWPCRADSMETHGVGLSNSPTTIDPEVCNDEGSPEAPKALSL